MEKLIELLKKINHQNYEEFKPILLKPETKENYWKLKDYQFDNHDDLLSSFYASLILERKLDSPPYRVSSVCISSWLFNLIQANFWGGDLPLSLASQANDKYLNFFPEFSNRQNLSPIYSYDFPNKEVALMMAKPMGFFEQEKIIAESFKQFDAKAKERWKIYQKRSHSLPRSEKLANYNLFKLQLIPFCKKNNNRKDFLALITLNIDFPLEMLETDLLVEFIDWLNSSTPFLHKYLFYKSLLGRGKVIKHLRTNLQEILFDKGGRLKF